MNGAVYACARRFKCCLSVRRVRVQVSPAQLFVNSHGYALCGRALYVFCMELCLGLFSLGLLMVHVQVYYLRSCGLYGLERSTMLWTCHCLQRSCFSQVEIRKAPHPKHVLAASPSTASKQCSLRTGCVTSFGSRPYLGCMVGGLSAYRH